MSSISFNHSFQSTSEGSHGPADLIPVQVGHGGLDGVLQTVQVPVAGLTGLLLCSPPQIVVTGIQVWAVGRLLLTLPEVWHCSQQPRLNLLASVCRCSILLEGVPVSPGHPVHSGNHHILQDIQVHFLVDLQAHGEEVRQHDVPIGGDHPEDHHCGWVLGPEDHGDVCWVLADPSGVLSVVLFVHIEQLLV